MAFYDFYDQGGGYDSMDMGYRNYGRNYYGRENHRQQPYYDAAPGMYRHDGGRGYDSEPYFENYRRDYRQGGGYTDGRFGVLPPEEVIRRVDRPQWMDDGYRHGGHQGGYRIDRRDYHGGHQGGYRIDLRDYHGGHQGGYRIDRRDYHGGQNYGHGNFLHLQDGYDHGDHHGSRRQEVELYVPLCCGKCERKLRKHLEYLQGVETITMDQTTKKVVVFGNVNPSYVLNRARLDKPESEFWHLRYR